MAYEYKKTLIGEMGWHNLEDMATKLVCYDVKGFKHGEVDAFIKAEVKVLSNWKNKMTKKLQDLLRDLQGKEFMEEFNKSVNTSLRKSVLNSMFPSTSGLQRRAEQSFGNFVNNIGATIKYGYLHGHTSVDLAVSDDKGHLVLHNFWMVFLGLSIVDQVELL